MLDSKRGLRLIASLAIILCIVASLTGARGEDKTTGGLRIATIDIDRVSNECKVLKAFRQEVEKRKQLINVQVQISRQNPLLTETEQKSLADLSLKEKTPGGPALTGAEKATQSALTDKSRKLFDDYQRLQGTAIGAVTEQDKAKLVEYQKLGTDSEARSKALADQAEAELQTKGADLMAQTKKNLHDALHTVAKEKGYNLVLNSEMAPYADFDCTDDVIKLLNK